MAATVGSHIPTMEDMARRHNIKKKEAWLHSPNVTLGSVLAVKKWDIGISPKVMYRLYLGLIQMCRKEGLGISPNVLYR